MWSQYIFLLSLPANQNNLQWQHCSMFISDQSQVKGVLTVSDFLILIKSCSIESRNDPNPKSEVVHETKSSLKISYSTHACLAQLDQHQTCKPVIISVVSSNPTGGNFIFLRHLDADFVQKWQKCQICVIYENFECIGTMQHIFIDVLSVQVKWFQDCNSVDYWVWQHNCEVFNFFLIALQGWQITQIIPYRFK